jgi:type VI secretion system protein VasD
MGRNHKQAAIKVKKAKRRDIVLGALFTALALSGCTTGGGGPAANPLAPQDAAPAPRTITVQLAASRDINPGPTGRAAPLPVEVYVLRSPGRFQSVDYFELKNNGGSALSGDLVDSRSLSLRPGQSTSITMTTGGDGAYIGVAGGFRDIDSANWRDSTAIGDGEAFTVRAGRSSVSVSGS